MTPRDDALDWLLRFSDPIRGVGWNARTTLSPIWKLARARALLDGADAPDRAVPAVTIAGTNGKGSTAAMLAAIVAATGLRVGLFTQPHLHHFRERIRIDGRPIDASQFANAVEAARFSLAVLARHHPEAGEPTTFELSVVTAASAFARDGVDLAIYEVGLGGRLDPVNAIDPIASAITMIDLDHVGILGHTITAIAREKSGIMRPGRVVVTGVQRSAAQRVLSAEARRVAARLLVQQPLARVGNRQNGLVVTVPGIDRPITPGLRGDFQRANSAIAVGVARALSEIGFTISDDAIASGLGATRWPGRMELVDGSPPILIDGAHNPAGARALAAAMRPLIQRGYDLIVGSAGDKDIRLLLAPFARRARRVWTTSAGEGRSADPDRIAEIARELGATVQAMPSVAAAIEAARSGGAQFIVATGSLRIAALAREYCGLADGSD